MKSCTACHSKVGSPDSMKTNPNLNDLGTCYQKNEHSLAKCNVAGRPQEIVVDKKS
ncbi:MAG: hypothetical protein WDO73_26095 [Ignavibacteriota bacterium]